jgi:ABC-type sugar transport system permease subunit
MISFVVFPAVYNTFISFTNWSTGHILNKSQAIQILESRTYTPDNQKGVEFDIYVMQDQELNFYYFADLNENEMYFGKAVKQEDMHPMSHQ